MIFLKLIKIYLIFAIVALPTAACMSTSKVPLSTQTPEVDCKAIWEQEQTDASRNLVFSLKLEKSKYKSDEPIFSTFILENVGTDPIWVNKRMIVNRRMVSLTGEVYFVIISPWGETAELVAKVDAIEPGINDFMLLKTFDTIEVKSDGILYYSYLSFWEPEGRRDDLSGRYCVWAVYHNVADPGLDGNAWKGKIKSNFVEYEIVQ